jgi:hypothetical protein
MLYVAAVGGAGHWQRVGSQEQRWFRGRCEENFHTERLLKEK